METLYHVKSLTCNIVHNLITTYQYLLIISLIQGYSRQGAALFSLQRYKEAEEAYHKGLELDPNNEQLQDGLRDTERKKSRKC